jgi:UDP-2-acetamido-3-amino-2,3-dideoxy-glucuronate N-acetyltransferase
MTARIHDSAMISPQADIGDGTSIWHLSQVREGPRVGSGCILGKNVYIDFDVQVGDNVKIQKSPHLI